MSILKQSSLLCGLLCFSFSAFAQWDKDGRGYIEFLHGVAENNINTSYADTVHLYTEGELNSQSQRLFVAIDTGYYRYSPEQSGLKLKEAYWSWLGNNADLTIGRQIIPWGKADGITVTDRISPKNRRQWLGTEYQDTRLGVDAVKFRYLYDDATSEFIWIPFPRFDALPSDSRNPLTNLYQPEKQEFNNNTFAMYYPKGNKPNSVKDSEWAIRQSFYSSNMDVSLSVFRGWDRQVIRIPKIKNNNIIMLPNYHRITQFGIDIAIPEGERVWRGEIAYLPNRLLVNKQGTISKYDQWLALFGLDWDVDSWSIKLQYFADNIRHATKLVRSPLQSSLSVSVDKQFLRDKLKLSTGSYIDLNQGSSAWMLKADYVVNDHLSFSSGINHFESGGQSNSTFASMVPLSSVWLKICYNF